MPTAGEDVARRFADAVTRCDREVAVGLCHPDIEFHSVLGISGKAYLGHDGIREYFDDVESAWARWRVEVEEVAEGADGRVLIVMTMHARGMQSGAAITERAAHIWSLREGRLVGNTPYRDSGEAMRALSRRPD